MDFNNLSIPELMKHVTEKANKLRGPDKQKELARNMIKTYMKEIKKQEDIIKQQEENEKKEAEELYKMTEKLQQKFANRTQTRQFEYSLPSITLEFDDFLNPTVAIVGDDASNAVERMDDES